MIIADDNASAFILKGDAFDQKFQPAQALAQYLPAEKLTPDDPELLIKIARQYVYQMDSLPSNSAKEKSARTALAYSKRAARLAPTRANTHLSLAICYGKLTPLLGVRDKIFASSKIKQAAERAIQLDPDNDYAWHLLGRWHQSLAAVGGFTRSLVKVVYGSMPPASYRESALCFEKAKKLNPKRLIHFVELGRTYAAMDRKIEALRYIQHGLTMKSLEFDDPKTKVRGREALKKIL